VRCHQDERSRKQTAPLAPASPYFIASPLMSRHARRPDRAAALVDGQSVRPDGLGGAGAALIARFHFRQDGWPVRRCAAIVRIMGGGASRRKAFTPQPAEAQTRCDPGSAHADPGHRDSQHKTRFISRASSSLAGGDPGSASTRRVDSPSIRADIRPSHGTCGPSSRSSNLHGWRWASVSSSTRRAGLGLACAPAPAAGPWPGRSGARTSSARILRAPQRACGASSR
jgi:hypothetical protein